MRRHLLHLLIEVSCVNLLRSFKAVGFKKQILLTEQYSMLIILTTPVKEDEHEEDPVSLLDAVLGEALDQAEACPQVAFVEVSD